MSTGFKKCKYLNFAKLKKKFDLVRCCPPPLRKNFVRARSSLVGNRICKHLMITQGDRFREGWDLGKLGWTGLSNLPLEKLGRFEKPYRDLLVFKTAIFSISLRSQIRPITLSLTFSCNRCLQGLNLFCF